jgi:hypothetical protein
VLPHRLTLLPKPVANTIRIRNAGTSAYRDNYRGHNIDPSQYNRTTGPAPYNPNTAPFDGKSSYMQDFPQHAVERRQPYSGGAYQPNMAPFEGTSHYKVRGDETAVCEACSITMQRCVLSGTLWSSTPT